MIQRYSELLKNYEYKIFTYGSYQENEYRSYIQSSEFGIWVGRHESQGFAFEEALSCNCPLFVYDIATIKDEYMDDGSQPFEHIPIAFPATAASYFDESCGMICKEKESLHNMFASFLQVIPCYTPRQFVLEHLTTTQFIERLQEIFNDKM
jgi:glycosyltransferase involved in cell wall biosynthesis